jgi:hypothetical protein
MGDISDFEKGIAEKDKMVKPENILKTVIC